MRTWKTDNGDEFRGEAIDGIGGISRELVGRRQYSVANTDNCNPDRGGTSMGSYPAWD